MNYDNQNIISEDMIKKSHDNKPLIVIAYLFMVFGVVCSIATVIYGIKYQPEKELISAIFLSIVVMLFVFPAITINILKWQNAKFNNAEYKVIEDKVIQKYAEREHFNDAVRDVYHVDTIQYPDGFLEMKKNDWNNVSEGDLVYVIWVDDTVVGVYPRMYYALDPSLAGNVERYDARK